MIHLYQHPKNNAPIFLLLHGTGGDEHDLVPFINTILPDAGYLSVRGEVNENGLNRFFKRIRPGVFDLEDLAIRTEHLDQFLTEASKQYQFNRSSLIALGYSNGANIAANVLLTKGAVFKAALLMHPMVPRRDIQTVDLKQTPILITAGQHDAMCPISETKELEKILTGFNAKVQLEWFAGGHEITTAEVKIISEFTKALN